MTQFSFRGRVPASKSLLNRWLTVSAHASELHINGNSNSDDVLLMRRGLRDLREGCVCDVGSAGTTFRFLSLLASRTPGEYKLNVSERLRERPHSGLSDLLRQLGVDAHWVGRSFRIHSTGWHHSSQPLIVDGSETSQFISGLLLNAWNLNFPLNICREKSIVSAGYLRLTLDVVRRAGMTVQGEEREDWHIPSHQKVRVQEVDVEPDMSSCFALAALAAVSGRAELLGFPRQSLQPDFIFIEILRSMGVSVRQEIGALIVESASDLKPVEVDLRETPDLFPVLAVLCSAANGDSLLYGAPQLRFKESDRIGKVSELLTALHISHCTRADGIEIKGGKIAKRAEPFDFDPDQDHRMAMAAQLARYMGYPIHILHGEVVTKSFPEFWNWTGAGSP